MMCEPMHYFSISFGPDVQFNIHLKKLSSKVYQEYGCENLSSESLAQACKSKSAPNSKLFYKKARSARALPSENTTLINHFWPE